LVGPPRNHCHPGHKGWPCQLLWLAPRNPTPTSSAHCAARSICRCSAPCSR
jgi:hypothetical protein